MTKTENSQKIKIEEISISRKKRKLPKNLTPKIKKKRILKFPKF